MSATTYPDMSSIFIQEACVHKLLRDLKVRKASGPDQVLARLLKEVSDVVAPALTLVFQFNSASFNGCKR